MIRSAFVTDIEACSALALQAMPERPTAEWRDSLLHDVENPNRRLFLAESGRETIGYGRAQLFEPAADAPADTAPGGFYLAGVFVRDDQRRRGIATALTQARLEWIGERGSDAWFFANARNTASIELHRQLGFEEVTRRFSFPGATFTGGEGILFRLRLSNRYVSEEDRVVG